MRKLNPKSYDYIASLFAEETKGMGVSRQQAETLGLDTISLSSAEGQLLQFFLKSNNAKKVVEIGTLTGLSAQYILTCLPQDGFLWTLEKSNQHAELAAVALANEIKNKRCEILIGDAREKLSEIVHQGPFDAVFIDGNKAAYFDYFNWAFQNIKKGGLILADNAFLSGAVWGDSTEQNFNLKQIEAVKKMNYFAFHCDQLRSCIIPTLEGLLISFKI